MTGEYQGRIFPPFSDVLTALSSASIGVRLKKMGVFLLGGGLFCGIIWLVTFLIGVGWLQVTGYVLCGLILAVMVLLALMAKVAPCPYCGKPLGTTPWDSLTAADVDELIECGHCFEWLISNEGQVRALTDEKEPPGKALEAPMFEEGVWPNECLVCGVPPVRTEEAKKAKVELSQLLVGQLSVASASINQIPYCDRHGGSVTMTIREEYPRLVFSDYAMRRRYVQVNSGKHAVKCG